MSSLTLNIKAMYNCLLGIKVVDPKYYLIVPTKTPSWTEGSEVLLSADLSVGCLNPVGSALEAQISQLKFLLANAPMMDAPGGDFDMSRINIPFVYIHPKTLAKLQTTCGKLPVRVQGAKSKWVPTSLMPEGRVIYSIRPMPGIEKILAE